MKFFRGMTTTYMPEKEKPEAAPAAAPMETNSTSLNEAPSPEEIANLQVEAARAKENWDRLLRITADFDNFKKRAARERQDAVRYANESLIEKLLPVLDNFDMAIAAARESQDENLESMLAGICMIQQQMKSTLADAGLDELDATGKAFDPNFHEAVSQQESSEVAEGHVLHQIRKGYRLKDRLLRPASVVVAKKPAAAAS